VGAIIVAGGSGYIGQEVVRAALNTRDRCYEGVSSVVNIDIRPPRPLHPQLRQNSVYFDINTHPRLKFIQADLADPKSAANAIDAALKWAGDVDGVANFCGLVKYGHGDERLYRPNVLTVQNLVSECAARNLLFTHFSGTAVHGNGLQTAVKEADPIRPVEAYGRSKAESEKVIFSAVRDRGLRAVIFRSTAPIGPGLQDDLNKLYETIVQAPVIPAVKGSNNTYVCAEDVGRAFVFSITKPAAVVPAGPTAASDIVYNLGVNKPFSDAQVMAHLQTSIYGKVKKPIIQIPANAAIGLGYVSTFAAKGLGFVLRREVEPTLHYELARLFKGWHYQDPSKFNSIFPAAGFTLKFAEPEEVLDVGTVYKFLTDWTERPKPERITALMRRFVDERTSKAYE
jgi:nucleoside-diphosphate-sugar epimerase